MRTLLSEPYEIDFTYKNCGEKGPSLHSHHRYEIFYFHSGECTYLIGGNVYMLEPGDVLLMNGMTLHKPVMEPGREYMRTVVHFDHGRVKPFLQALQSIHVLKPFQDFSNYRLSLRGNEKKEVERLLASMALFYDEKNGHRYHRFRLRFIDLLYFIFEEYRKSLTKTRTCTNHKEQHIQRVISFLEAHYQEDITMQVVEDHVHMNKYYLATLFKEVTGKTIFNFLFEVRINQAKALFLMNKRVTVTEVAFQVGFKHLSHFSRLFKQQVGCPPGKFRKLYRE